MNNISKLSVSERQELIIATAAKMKMSEAIVEKDFWVCFCLDYLFHNSKWKNALAFKGGTSLSKAYNLIERFSEDIDLILDWRILGYSINEPWNDRSNTKQLEFLDDANNRLIDFLKNDFLKEFKEGISVSLGEQANIFIKDEEPEVVYFSYPKSFSDDSILSEIRLEIGAMAAWTPTRMMTITPFVSECYPDIFDKKSTQVLTTTAERTFWEKATILHQEAYRPDYSRIPSRYSRHYYDFYCMSNSSVKQKALEQFDLLIKVAEFKNKFYPRKWARYDLAKQGLIKLIPAEHSISKLKEDYRIMHSMIYGEYPSFDDVLERLKELEEEIHNYVTVLDFVK